MPAGTPEGPPWPRTPAGSRGARVVPPPPRGPQGLHGLPVPPPNGVLRDAAKPDSIPKETRSPPSAAAGSRHGSEVARGMLPWCTAATCASGFPGSSSGGPFGTQSHLHRHQSAELVEGPPPRGSGAGVATPPPGGVVAIGTVGTCPGTAGVLSASGAWRPPLATPLPAVCSAVATPPEGGGVLVPGSSSGATESGAVLTTGVSVPLGGQTQLQAPPPLHAMGPAAGPPPRHLSLVSRCPTAQQVTCMSATEPSSMLRRNHLFVKPGVATPSVFAPGSNWFALVPEQVVQAC